ncbi:hypothetical protein [Succinispira mobilis]|uniref:hypothetical protein n=1 Tax=Succinispira mobilis TaxID=78120 RepID=UPI00037FD520|nr:hypothetical protein [Succinispira mobilis]
MKKVTFTFVGQDSEIMAEKLYNWYVDGGLEDLLVDTLTEEGPASVETLEIDNAEREIILSCTYKNM